MTLKIYTSVATGLKLKIGKFLHIGLTIFTEKGIWGAGGRGTCLPYFLQSLIFCNHFEVPETVLFEVEMIINNALLTCVHPNTIETCLTPNHLLFGRELLYSSNTTSIVATNLTVLSSTTDKINRNSSHFWDR